MDGKNRRRHTRVRARNIAAHLRVEDKASTCQVEDISQGGLFVRTDQRLPVGLAVVIDLARPGLKRPLRVSGVVAQSSDGKHGIGIRFDTLDEDAHARLGEILRDLGAYTSEPAPAPTAARARPAATGAAAPQTATATTTGQTHNPFARPQPMATAGSSSSMPPAPLGAPAASGATQPPKSSDDGRLMIQIKGLMLELGSREQALSSKEREAREAKEEIEKLRHELRRKDDQLYALDQAKLAAERTAGRLGTEKEALERALLVERGGAGGSLEKLRAEAELALEHAARVAEITRKLR